MARIATKTVRESPKGSLFPLSPISVTSLLPDDKDRLPGTECQSINFCNQQLQICEQHVRANPDDTLTQDCPRQARLEKVFLHPGPCFPNIEEEFS